MADLPNIDKRLQLLRIDNNTTNVIYNFYPILKADIDNIISRFYSLLLLSPEGKAMFTDPGAIEALKPRQRDHWLSLFSCKFDAAYIKSALNVGRVHYGQKVAPYIYMSSYNFFHSELNKTAWRTWQDKPTLPDLLDAVSRLVSLDMELALSAYTRERWLNDDQFELAPDPASAA